MYPCSACGAQIEPGVTDCPRCGRAVQTGVQEKAASSKRPRSKTGMIDRPWFVLGMLFCVTAALGLPILWKSRGFSPLAKVLLSLLVTVYTVILLWGFWLLMSWCVTRIMDVLA
jgi:hypothetical protein